MIINQDNFSHFIRCAKAGFLFEKKPGLVESETKLKHSKDDEIKQHVCNIIENYLGADKSLIKDQVFGDINGTSAKADLLRETDKGLQLFGIYYSNEIPDWIEIMKLAFTYYVMLESGAEVESIISIVVNKNCRIPGTFTIEDLKLKNCTEEIKRRLIQVEQKVESFRKYLRKNATPTNKIDMYCIKPGLCPFLNYCEGKEFPETSIMKLQGFKFYRKLQLKWSGYVDLRQPLPKNQIMDNKTLNQISILGLGKKHVDENSIKEWINAVSAKQFIWFWDFELYTSIRPIGNNNETFVKYPYLYTLYWLDLKNNIKGKSVELILPNFNTEAVNVLCNKLLSDFSVNSSCHIVVSNLRTAKECLNNLCLAFPEHRNKLEQITARLKDIRSLFADYYYYDPRFNGSLYLKDIIPIICPDISYENLKFKSGIQAQLGYRTMVNEGKTDLAADLKEYSVLDAKSLMRAFEFLKAVCK
ncbi:MAG: DUF2779 domain-containing protein [Bacteroidia bacterium]